LIVGTCHSILVLSVRSLALTMATHRFSAPPRFLVGAAAMLSLAACAAASPAGRGGAIDDGAAAAAADSGAFTIAADPHGAAGAPWSFRGTVDGVRYDLTGVLFAPGGSSETGASRANVLRAHMTRELLRRLPYVDNSRVAAHGHSLGAYLQVAWLAAYPGDVRVASATGGGIRPPQSRIVPAPTIDEAAHISAPYQMHHGSADQTVPLSWDERLAAVLREHGVSSALYVYDGGHLAPRADPLMFARVRAWYAAYGAK